MQFQLKSISVESIPEALAKVERYRLLNEPRLAESICLDILAVVPDHQQALISLLLARTDQFRSSVLPKSAQEVLPQLKGDFEQAYYAGIIWERLANARIRDEGMSKGGASVYHMLRDAMTYYEKAMSSSSSGADKAILRWNTCARILNQNPQIQPSREEAPALAWSGEGSSRIPDV